MTHIVFDVNDKKSISSAIKESQKSVYNSTSPNKSQLLQIFTAITDENRLKEIIKTYRKYFPNAIIIGATTAGEIAHAKMYESSTVVSLSLFAKTTIKAKYTKKIDNKSGVKLASKICNKKTKAAIILSEGLYGRDYTGFIEGFKEDYPNIILAGGLAGDNFKLKKTLIFLDKNIYDTGSVALSFSGKSLFADNKYNLNWTPIGKKFTITSSTGNVVHKIDNMGAVSLFKKYLGEEIFANGAKALPDFQLLYKDGSTTVSRTPMEVNGESIAFAAAIKEGQIVQFGFSNASSVIAGANEIKKEIQNNPADGIYVFSCIARKTLLGAELEKEFENFEKIAPTAGFFTYGEYYSTSQNNAMLNCTTTLLILSESTKNKKDNFNLKQKKHKATDNKISEIGDITFSALTHFVKQTADELNKNVKLLNQYKDAVDSALYVSKTDKNGVITFVNDNFCRTSQYSREELLGQYHSIVRDPSLPASFFKKMWTSIQSGKTWKGSFPNRAKDGSTYYVNATIMPTFDDNQEIDGYIAIRLDITKEVLSKNRMKEKENLIKAIFDNQDSIVVLASKTEGMLYVNKVLFKYFDFKSVEDFKSRHQCICELFINEEGYMHPDKDPNWLHEIAMNDEKDYKVKMLSKENKVHTFNIKVKMINEDYIINLSDITRLETALLKAYASEQAKSIFLANMSHEIRTPLNGILGFSELLSKRALDKDSARYIDIINKSGQTLLHVVNDILDFSKLESGELSLHEIETNLFAEMEASVATFASTSKSKHIDYYTYIDTNIPKALKCDAQRIKQVINNLTSNAIKFTPEGGKVTINIVLKEIIKNEAVIHFSVNDSGIGIAKDKLSSVFQAFSQADNSISREFGGTGLGLAISSQYIEMMHSKLKVKSELSIGSEFYFDLKLPIIDASQNIAQDIDITKKNIVILQPTTKIECGINEIIESYLQRWMCHFTKIETLDEINDKTDIVIVCAKNFDSEICQEALNKYEKLQLIYIEGGEVASPCHHKKFHLLEQPMTGSALFDKIITLTHNASNIVQTNNESVTKLFDGTVLVAEDNATNQMLISIMLDQREITYKIVENGQEAVDEALIKEYDLIFMDVNMPVLDGISATKILREKGYEKPIVSLSANVIESDIVTFMEAGVNEALNKPIVTEQLDDVLTKYLSEKVQINDMVYDKIDIEKLATALSLLNEELILKLLNTFKESAEEMIKKIELHKLDKEVLHSIKGSAGNLRFNELYTLVKQYEDEFSDWSEEENLKKSEIIISHLKKAISNIELLNK